MQNAELMGNASGGEGTRQAPGMPDLSWREGKRPREPGFPQRFRRVWAREDARPPGAKRLGKILTGVSPDTRHTHAIASPWITLRLHEVMRA